MAKIISYDRNFIYIDEGDKMLEVKRNMITFDPVPGSEVIVYRNRSKEITQIELVQKIKEKEKPVEVKEETKDVVLEEPKEEIIEDVEDEPTETLEVEERVEATVLVQQTTRHTNRYIEIFLGLLTIFMFNGIFVAFAPFLRSIVNISILSGVVVIGLIYTFLALFLKSKKARYGLTTVIIVGYILLFLAGIGLIFFEPMVRQFGYIDRQFNRFPLLSYAGQVLQLFSLIPVVLGIKYWCSRKKYFNS